MEKLMISDLLEGLDCGEYGEELQNYRSETWICDAINEISDSNTNIYYRDIMDFISDNPDEVNEAINEFGWDGCGCDIYKAGQFAQYNVIARNIDEHLEDSIKSYAYNYCITSWNLNEIDEDLNTLIEENCIDHNSRLREIEVIIDNYLLEVQK